MAFCLSLSLSGTLLSIAAGPLNSGSSGHGEISAAGLDGVCVEVLVLVNAGATKFLTGCFLGFRTVLGLAGTAIFVVDETIAVPRGICGTCDASSEVVTSGSRSGTTDFRIGALLGSLVRVGKVLEDPEGAFWVV